MRASAPAARPCRTSTRSPSTRRSTWSPWPTWTCAASIGILNRFPKARVYQDWRELLKKEADASTRSTSRRPTTCTRCWPSRRCGTASTSTCRSRWPTRCARHALLTEYARKARVISQMGIQVSSMRPQRYGEWLVQKRHRRQDPRGAHVLEQELGRRQAAARRRGPGPVRRSTGTSGSASRELAAVQARRLPPRRMAAAHRVRHRHARRHGLPHLQPAVSRA